MSAAVTVRAVMCELGRHVIRILCLRVVRLVTLPAVGVLDGIVTAYVAGLAGLGRMRALEREIRRGMIER